MKFWHFENYIMVKSVDNAELSTSGLHTLMSTLSLAHTLRQQLLHSKTPIQPTRRWLAEAVGLIPDPSNSKETVGPVDWRKRKVSVREDHGLWGFFRRRESENEEELKGEAKYMICETPSMETSGTYLSRIIQTICFFLF